MKNLLIIYPHWPPSNLAGVHRPRLISNNLPGFGWQPIVLTVHEKYYEEILDMDMLQTVKEHVEVIKVKAMMPPKRFRIIGDIGLRAFVQLLTKAKKIIRTRKISAIWIPVPNYYCMLLGRLLHNKYKIPYGIDYIDPWSDGIPGAEKKFSRAWLSNKLALILEPFALKKASFITGVNEEYYNYIFNKNWVNKDTPNVGMPYGFEVEDHEKYVNNIELPWNKIGDCKAFIYAGAFLPKSRYFLNLLFDTIKQIKEAASWPQNGHLFFVGTGNYPGKSISEYAEERDISDVVHESRERLPYLFILNILSESKGVMIIGSTEKHYTASKTFQALLSKNPVFAILHEQSSACSVISEAGADAYLVKYNPRNPEEQLKSEIKSKFLKFITSPGIANPDMDKLGKYSAKASTQKLVNILEKLYQ